MEMLEKSAITLSAIGAINLGIVKFANLDLVAKIPGSMSANIVYGVIVAAGLVALYNLYK